jgi:hypothetical protein
MKIRSKALYDYLLLSNVLTGSPETIARAKQEYRRLYKRQWKHQGRQQKEIRFSVTLRQFATIKAKAQAMSIGHTTHARNIVLASIQQPITHNNTLLAVLQAVSMAAITIEQGKPIPSVYELLRNAELMLLQYLII